jgi:NAD(P)-dependent dehydrogenase (short-subunit alcohol dehydrogenase family)
MKVENKVFVVTGGGNGIGQQVVLELLRRGARVGAADIRDDSLTQTQEIADSGDRLSTHVLDITDRAATHAFPEQVVESHGAVDGTINVAGIIQPFVKLNDLDYEAIVRVVDVNLYGTIHMVKAFLPLLLQRPEAHIANISSMGGFLPVPGQTIYGASKAAVKLMTEGLYAELLDTNVGVSVIFPGAVATEITSNSGVAIPGGAGSAEESKFPTTSPEDAARIIIDGIEDDEFHIYVGRDARLMNLANRAAPRRSTHLIYNKMKDLLS